MRTLLGIIGVAFVSLNAIAGTVADRMHGDSFRTEFSRDVCHLDWSRHESWPKKDSKECEDRLTEVYVAELKQQYPLAQPLWVLEQCEKLGKPAIESEELEDFFEQSQEHETKKNVERKEIQYQLDVYNETGPMRRH